MDTPKTPEPLELFDNAAKNVLVQNYDLLAQHLGRARLARIHADDNRESVQRYLSLLNQNEEDEREATRKAEALLREVAPLHAEIYGPKGAPKARMGDIHMIVTCDVSEMTAKLAHVADMVRRNGAPTPEAETPSEPTPEEFITDAIARKANVCLIVGPHEPKISDVHAAFSRLYAAGYSLKHICPVIPVTEGVCQYRFELPQADPIASPAVGESSPTHRVLKVDHEPLDEQLKIMESLLNAEYCIEKTLLLDSFPQDGIQGH